MMTTEKTEKKMTKKRRFILVLIFIGLFSLSYQIGSLIQVSEEEAKLLMDQFAEISKDIDGFGIFIHNLTINGLMFIPGFGVIMGLFTSFETGLAFSAFASTEPMLQGFPALAVLFLSPFGIMELFAYGIAMSRSYLIAMKLIKRNESLKSDLKPVLIEVGIVISLLLIGGLLEAYMIDWASESGFNMVEMLK